MWTLEGSKAEHKEEEEDETRRRRRRRRSKSSTLAGPVSGEAGDGRVWGDLNCCTSWGNTGTAWR